MVRPGPTHTDDGIHLGTPNRVRLNGETLEKKCDVCNLWKDLTSFHINLTHASGGRTGYRSYRARCRKCYALKRLAWKSNRHSRVSTRAEVDRSFVYFIQCGEYVKIGKSNNVEQRLLALRTGNPFPLNVLGSIECQSEAESYRLENHLHSHFKDWHHQDEWFVIGHQILDFIHTATK